MWAFSSSQVTVYSIQPWRGFEQAATVLGVGFEGFLVRDGWIVYREFSQAIQTRLAHLLRRCWEMILVAGAGAREFPHSVQEILQRALQLRDRRDRGQVGDLGVAVARGRLEARLDRTLQRRFRSPRTNGIICYESGRLLFTFLNCPGPESTNWRAEQAIRPMVVTREVWGAKPHYPRSTHAKRLGQHSADLPPATPPGLIFPAEADLLTLSPRFLI